ncbi:MAG: prepilin-type N-terminal cleavage/methylation domain-containing protein [Clostridium butyricum]|nr:prepilin-type N-terminal cleavage/methylation domain-containing protein [Clostridium butyricum]
MYKNSCNLDIKRKRKKEGFTLIELIAVIAIIIILSGVLFPKVLGYVQEAKKLKVVDQCRKIVMANESYSLRYTPLEKSQNVSNIINKNGISKYLEENELNNINIQNTTIQNCYDIVNGAEFRLNTEGGSEILDSSSIEYIEAIR